MLNIFISYHHQCEAIVRTLVEDIEVLGHTVWFDEELSGGPVTTVPGRSERRSAGREDAAARPRRGRRTTGAGR